MDDAFFWILFGVLWAVFGGCRWSGRPVRLHGGWRRWRGHAMSPLGTGVAAPRPAARPELPPESPVDALQRRYVEGRITVEEYEAGLDRLFRSGTRAG